MYFNPVRTFLLIIAARTHVRRQACEYTVTNAIYKVNKVSSNVINEMITGELSVGVGKRGEEA